jgi:hypothetical protein
MNGTMVAIVNCGKYERNRAVGLFAAFIEKGKIKSYGEYINT